MSELPRLLVDTPFGLRRHLLLSFPQVAAASVSVPTPQQLVVRYVPDADGSPDHSTMIEWVKQNKTAGIGFDVQRVTMIQDSELPAAQLTGTSLPVDVAEDAAINLGGMYDLMKRLWPDDFVRFDNGPGRVNCVVSSTTTRKTQLAMQVEISLLLHGVAVTSQSDTKNASRSQVASRAELKLAEDWDRMYELCNDAVGGAHQPPQLPAGAYAFLPLKPASLFCHLAIAGRVYVEMPRTIEEMNARYGVPWGDFVDAMSTGRVVPVFRLPARMYERSMIDVILDAGGTCILPGENRLRELAAFVEEVPAVAMASRLDDAWRTIHAAVRRHPEGVRLQPFFDAVAQAAARARMVARRADFMAKTWAPIAFAIDDALKAVGRERRDIEFMGALDVMTAAQGCGTRPIIPDGDLLGQYVQLLYGSTRPAGTPKAGESALVKEPAVVAKIVLERARGISLRQFAESFNGPAIEAMHRLMESPRLVGADLDDTVTDFEREMHEFNGRRKKLGAASIGVDGALALVSLSAGWGLLAVAVTVIGKYLIAKSVLTDEQTAKLLRSSKEAAYLARIDAAIKNQ